MGLPEVLVQESTLSKKQLESLQSYLKVRRGEMMLKQAASQRSGRPVTIGSYYGTVRQGREKVRKSMVTVLIGLWLGMIKLEDSRRLFEYVGKGAESLSEEEIERLSRLLRNLVERIVM
jgi:hypothetical protein